MKLYRVSIVFLIMMCFCTLTYGLSLEWVNVGDAGNNPDTTGFGSVSYDYQIGKYEVTNSQYTEFLNAVAAEDTYGLYNVSMASLGIERSGSSGSYSYATKTGWENKPVSFVSWWCALRFANWVYNGLPTGAQTASTTEDGAYTFSGAASVSGRNADATVWIPTENEWYKAAYYNADLDNYWDFPVQSNTINQTQANYGYGTSGGPTNVGSYEYPGPYGTYDQGGNINEWTETIIPTHYCNVRGSSWQFVEDYLKSDFRGQASQGVELETLGFRLASESGFQIVPEPVTIILMGISAALCILRKRK